MKIIKAISQFAIATIIISFCLMTNVSAEQKIIEADGSYTIGDGLDENISVAKERAKTEALRNASEQASVFVESLTITQNSMVTKDEIKVISSNIMQLQGEPKFKVIPISDDVIRYQCHVVVLVDTSNINEKILSDKAALNEAVRQNKELTDEIARLNSEMEKLKKQYTGASTDEERQQIRQAVKQNDENFVAAQLNEQGVTLYSQNRYSEAIITFTKAISKNPYYAYAYNNRGNAHINMQNYNKAIEDYTQAISCDNNYAYAYHNRGVVYNKLHEYNKAISDFNQAIALDSNYVTAYISRGYCYGQMKEYQKAISDFNLAVTLNDKIAAAYVGRGFAYCGIENYEIAITDFNKAIALDPFNADAFYGRGNAYTNLQHYQEALRDYKKALSINPNLKSVQENIDMLQKANIQF